jgi:hypothetical protein
MFIIFTIILCRAPEQQYKQSIKAPFQIFLRWTIFVLIFMQFFRYKQNFATKKLQRIVCAAAPEPDIKKLKKVDEDCRKRKLFRVF